MNTLKLPNCSHGFTLFAALSAGYIVGAHQKETAKQVEIIIRSPYQGEALPLQNARMIYQEAPAVPVSFKSTPLNTPSPTLQYSLQEDTVAQPKTITVELEASKTNETLEISGTVPNEVVQQIRTKIFADLDQIDIQKIGSNSPSQITYAEERLNNGTTKIRGSITPIAKQE